MGAKVSRQTEKALKDVNKGMSVALAALKHGIVRTTIYYHINKVKKVVAS